MINDVYNFACIPAFAIDCRRQPCFQGSSCEPIFNGRTLSGYRCFCSDGYTGSYCEIGKAGVPYPADRWVGGSGGKSDEKSVQ